MTGRLRRLLHQVFRFLLGAGLGLAVDLGLFALGVRLGAPPWLANVVSAGCSVVVVYLFVTTYAFAAERSRTGFLFFVSWYVVSIVAFSAFIEALHTQTGWTPFVCKLVSIPPSFAANFVASRLLLHRRGARAPKPMPRLVPARDRRGA